MHSGRCPVSATRTDARPAESAGVAYSLFKKKPPNSMKGMTTGGPMDSAMDTLLEMQEIRYPAAEKVGRGMHEAGVARGAGRGRAGQGGAGRGWAGWSRARRGGLDAGGSLPVLTEMYAISSPNTDE